MKTFKMLMLPTRGLAMSLLGLCILSGLDSLPVRADFTFGDPVNIESTIPVFEWTDSIECFSYDGLEIYLSSASRVGGSGNTDLWVSRRASIDENWGPPENLGPVVNSPNPDYCASISYDGLTLYFTSGRPGGYGQMDMYMTTRMTKNDPWGQTVNLGPKINTSQGDGGPWLSPDGLELYFDSRRPGGYGSTDIYVARRDTINDTWGQPVNLGPVVNSSHYDGWLSLSPDGLLLLFSDFSSVDPPRPGGYDGGDIWMTRRASLSDPWQTPVNLGPRLNRSGHEMLPRISPDGRTLFFWDLLDDVYTNWQASIEPIVDFNADGFVDIADVSIMIEYWHTDYSLCDIGPMPWGDGFVDAEDLKVLAEHLYEQQTASETSNEESSE